MSANAVLLLNFRDLGSDLSCDRDFARDLVLELDRARDLARDLDRDLTHDLACTHDRAFALARCFLLPTDFDLDLRLAFALAFDRADDRAFDGDRALARTRTHNLALALERDLACARDLALTLDLVLTRTRARGLARARVRACGLARARDRARGLARALDRDLARTRNLVLNLDRALGVDPSEMNAEPEHVPVARPAVRVADAAAGLLPLRDRARYREEYQGELAELAAAGAGRWQQLRYTLRLLTRSAQLRVRLAGTKPRREAAR